MCQPFWFPRVFNMLYCIFHHSLRWLSGWDMMDSHFRDLNFQDSHSLWPLPARLVGDQATQEEGKEGCSQGGCRRDWWGRWGRSHRTCKEKEALTSEYQGPPPLAAGSNCLEKGVCELWVILELTFFIPSRLLLRCSNIHSGVQRFPTAGRS